MGIYKKGQNWYIDFYVNGRRKREKVGINKKLAEAVLAKRKVQVVEGKFFDIKRNEKIKFADIARTFLENYSRINKKSYRRDVSLINNLNGSFQGKYLYEINSLDIEIYKKKRISEGAAPGTVNRELSCLRCLLNRAIEWGKLKTIPPKIRLFRENNERVRYLERMEAEQLIKFSPEPLKSIVIIALNTGMRLGEILGLRWRDIDLKSGNITLWDTKNKEKRQVPINSTVIDTLMAVNKSPDSDFVFPGRNPSAHIHQSYISHKFNRIRKQAGIKDFRFHDLRHTFASWLTMKGINLKTVQELLGHKDFKMTLRYAHLSPDHKKQAVEFLVEKNTEGLDWTLFGHQRKNKNLKAPSK